MRMSYRLLRVLSALQGPVKEPICLNFVHSTNELADELRNLTHSSVDGCFLAEDI
jgi:hypothetical protein